jgi:GTPase SAR1 family protein
METTDYATKRRAVYDAMKGVLPAERLDEAMGIWEREFAGDATVAPVQLANALDEQMHLGPLKGELHDRLAQVQGPSSLAGHPEQEAARLNGRTGPPVPAASARDVRQALERIVVDSIMPVARWYGYSEGNLRLCPNWKPIVLLIGNYSSGKSTLINELLGGTVQLTGQAPTDDSFTILVSADETSDQQPGRVVEEVPGSTIVNDPSMPFGEFKNFGSRFMAHFTMKKVSSPALRHLAVIDSPGMLDSVTEQDRGYDYQHVIGRFAELADLVVLMFDPHKAGTVKETYVSIRSTLPEATSEDRVVFVMNRVDECKSFTELARCYGVLCWNLSQMTGRKDIPRVFLTYSPAEARRDHALTELSGERAALLQKINQAPDLQTNHLLGTVDLHLHKLELLARTMDNATRSHFQSVKRYFTGAVLASVVGALAVDTGIASLFQAPGKGLLGRLVTGDLTGQSFVLPALAWFLLFMLFVYYFRSRWHPRLLQRLMHEIGRYTQSDTQYKLDLWESIRPKCIELLGQPRQLWWISRHRAYANRLRKLIDVDLKELFEMHVGGRAAVP